MDASNKSPRGVAFSDSVPAKDATLAGRGEPLNKSSPFKSKDAAERAEGGADVPAGAAAAAADAEADTAAAAARDAETIDEIPRGVATPADKRRAGGGGGGGAVVADGGAAPLPDGAAVVGSGGCDRDRGAAAFGGGGGGLSWPLCATCARRAAATSAADDGRAGWLPADLALESAAPAPPNADRGVEVAEPPAVANGASRGVAAADAPALTGAESVEDGARAARSFADWRAVARPATPAERDVDDGAESLEEPTAGEASPLAARGMREDDAKAPAAPTVGIGRTARVGDDCRSAGCCDADSCCPAAARATPAAGTAEPNGSRAIDGRGDAACCTGNGRRICAAVPSVASSAAIRLGSAAPTAGGDDGGARCNGFATAAAAAVAATPSAVAGGWAVARFPPTSASTDAKAALIAAAAGVRPWLTRTRRGPTVTFDAAAAGEARPGPRDDGPRESDRCRLARANWGVAAAVLAGRPSLLLPDVSSAAASGLTVCAGSPLLPLDDDVV